MSVIETVLVFGGGVLLAWLGFHSWARERVGRGASDLAKQMFPIWAALGPFESGWQSAEAMRCAWTAGGVQPPDQDTLRRHADSYDSDVQRWEGIRRDALRTNPSQLHMDRAKRLLSREGPPVGLGWLDPTRSRRRAAFAKHVLRKLRGARSLEAFEALVPAAAHEWRSSNSTPEGAAEGRYNPYVFDELAWKTRLGARLAAVASHTSERAQSLALRASIVDAVCQIAFSEYVLSSKCDDLDAGLVTSGVPPLDGRPTPEIFAESSQAWQRGQLDLSCFRTIARDLFNDATENDYLQVLLGSARLYYENVLAMKAHAAKGEIFVMEALVPLVERTFRQHCEAVQAGGNFDATALIEQRDEEESSSAVSEIPKVDEIREDQLEALTELILGRAERMRTGTLYRVGDLQPIDVATAVRIDSALMMIGLSDCVADTGVADAAIRRVLLGFLDSLDLTEEQRAGINQEEIQLEEQHQLLQLYGENRAEGPLPPVLLVASAILFGVDASRYEQLSAAEREAFGGVAFKIFDDAYEMIGKTKAFFGHSYTGRVFDDHQPAS